ncbi:DUF4158 domain-containing protein [Paenibacillus agricola]|uniref:DUF4158 domain-containing protein n=1 Tax=Paenibacillus agricola TaxID=2716264 RepID=UPI0028933CFB|nr:DUF4158 domain-containing protein [Paenibacillus agricola]
MQIPSDDDWDLGTYTFSQHDLDIINKHRRDHNRLGFAVQLAILRYLGWSLSDLKHIPDSVISYISKQVGVAPDVFPLYAQREPTRREHMEEIRQTYGYRNFTLREYRFLSNIMLNFSFENGNYMYLIRVALDELRKQKIIIPGMTTIERVVWEVRQRAEEKIYKMLISSLSVEQIDKLENILSPMPESNKTYLAWLREVPGTCSPDAFLKIIEKLEYIRKVQLQIDTKGIHPNRLRQLSKIGARYEPQSFRRFDDPKKYATLVAYLLDLTQDLTDQAFEIHDRQILQLHSLSPIQYQKQLRLQEVRRILLTDDIDVTSAAFEVGYESLTQFNREYKRFFGLPPLKDIRTIGLHAKGNLHESAYAGKIL